MGFRSTFTTLDYPIVWPSWFREKYKGDICFPENNCGALHSIKEAKSYGVWVTLHEDIQQAIDWDSLNQPFVLVYLHECGGVTRCQIGRTHIIWSEPKTWNVTDGVTHSYCGECFLIS